MIGPPVSTGFYARVTQRGVAPHLVICSVLSFLGDLSLHLAAVKGEQGSSAHGMQVSGKYTSSSRRSLSIGRQSFRRTAMFMPVP